MYIHHQLFGIQTQMVLASDYFKDIYLIWKDYIYTMNPLEVHQ